MPTKGHTCERSTEGFRFWKGTHHHLAPRRRRLPPAHRRSPKRRKSQDLTSAGTSRDFLKVTFCSPPPPAVESERAERLTAAFRLCQGPRHQRQHTAAALDESLDDSILTINTDCWRRKEGGGRESGESSRFSGEVLTRKQSFDELGARLRPRPNLSPAPTGSGSARSAVTSPPPSLRPS